MRFLGNFKIQGCSGAFNFRDAVLTTSLSCIELARSTALRPFRVNMENYQRQQVVAAAL